MNSQLSTGNDRLSFDILGIVFYHYSTQESPPCRLGTLLQVCHAWREAALGHRSIWGRIKIVLQPEIPFRAHEFYILSLLERSGPIVPLDIDIATASNHKTPCNRCLRIATYPYPHTCQSSVVADILNLLAGPDGDRCRQWRTLHLQPEWRPNMFEEEEASHYIKALTYPMPALEELYLKNFVPPGQVFPSCPRLATIHFDNVQLKTRMDIGNAGHIVYASHASFIEDGIPTDLSAARRLETFHLALLGDGESVFLPQSLPFLTKLTVEDSLPSHFRCPTMPRLTHLNISRTSWHARYITKVLRGINLYQLQVLEIRWSYDWPRKSGWPFNDLTHLLTHLDNNILLKASPFVFMALLKLKWDTTKAQLKNKQNTVGVDFFRRGNLNVEIEGEEDSICISKDESLTALEKMAIKRVLPIPLLSWNKLLREWSRMSVRGARLELLSSWLSGAGRPVLQSPRGG